MDDLDTLLIGKKEPWYRRTPQTVMEIRLISLDELIRTPLTCEETRDRISAEEPLSCSAWMDDLTHCL